MANNFINPNWVSMKILRLLVNKLEISQYFNHEWERDYEKEFAPGATITVKFPQRFLVIDGMGYEPQGINRISTTITLDQWKQIPFEWDDYETAVKLERSEKELEDNYFKPAAEAMKQSWDSSSANWCRYYASNVTGALGVNPTSVSTYYTARQILMQQACPEGDWAMGISSSMMNSIGSNITSIFHPGDEVTRMFKNGYLGRLAGFDFFESNSLYSHTAGTWASSVTVSVSGQSGTAITITGTNGDTVNQGDKFAIQNVNATNPMTYRTAGPLTAKTFTATQPLTLTGGNDTLNFLPAIYGPGSQYQNVDALPLSGAALTLWPGTTSPNGKVGTVGIGISKYAFFQVGAKLFVPEAVEQSGQASDSQSGMNIRKVKAWDPVRSMIVNRLDSLGGYGNAYQDNCAVCVVGA